MHCFFGKMRAGLVLVTSLHYNLLNLSVLSLILQKNDSL